MRQNDATPLQYRDGDDAPSSAPESNPRHADGHVGVVKDLGRAAISTAAGRRHEKKRKDRHTKPCLHIFVDHLRAWHDTVSRPARPVASVGKASGTKRLFHDPRSIVETYQVNSEASITHRSADED